MQTTTAHSGPLPAARRRRPRRIPYVQQLEATGCGAACLAMVLRYHGKRVPLTEVTTAIGSGANGADARGIVSAARQFGLTGGGARLDIEHLAQLAPGAILHWEFDHFVVFERSTRTHVYIVDPRLGRRRVEMRSFRASFTGIALLVQPGSDFSTCASPTAPSSWRYAKTLVQAIDRGLLVRVVALSLLLQMFALALPLLTGAIVDRVIPGRDLALFSVLLLGCGFLLAIDFFTQLLRSHLLLHFTARLDLRLTSAFVSRLLDLPFSFFQRRPVGDLLDRLAAVEHIRGVMTGTLMSAAFDGMTAVGYLVLLCVYSPSLALVAVGVASLQALPALASTRLLRERTSQSLESQAQAGSYAVEMLSGIATLKAMGMEARALDFWSQRFCSSLNAGVRVGSIEAALDAARAALARGSRLLALAFGAWLVLHSHFTVGTMLALVAMLHAFVTPAAGLVSTYVSLNQVGSYVERVDEVLTAAPEQASEGESVSEVRGHIQMRGVSFHYARSGPAAIHDVDLTIEPGQCVAIVGPTGAGKTTLGDLLIGLSMPTSGSVSIDDRRVEHLDLRALRKHIGVVRQDAYIFGGSVRSNVALARPDASLEDVEHACRVAGLHDEIVAMPMGYASWVADGGSSISGGQRQRLAIARSVLAQPAILLLDEATSALDARTESRVHEALRALQCTRILIAHRLSTVQDADRIVVMDAGRITAIGTHDELMSASPLYAELVQRQLTPPARKPS